MMVSGNFAILALILVFLSLSRGTNAASATDEAHRNDPDRNWWIIHGTLAFLAWGAAAPLAVFVALLRRLVGDPLWFNIHWIANTVCVLLTLIAFACAVFAMSRKPNPHHYQKPASKFNN